MVIAIDAGHGGKDRGGVVRGRVEAKIALQIAERVSVHVSSMEGFAPFMTRAEDKFVALTDRVLLAEDAGAKAFMSVHCDKVYGRESRGVMVYIYGRNPGIPKGPPREPGEKILPAPPKSQVAASRRLAARILRTLKEHKIKRVTYVDKGGFAVLKSPTIPSVLVEVGNLRDKAEAAQFSDPAFQDRLGKALAESLREYLAEEARRAPRS